MKNLIRPFFILSLSLLASCPVQAAFDPAIVQGDSQWVVYVDFNSLRETTLGKELLDQLIKLHPPVGDGKVQVNFPQLLATLGSVTAYGAHFSKDPKLVDGALVFQGTSELRKIAEGYVAQATVTTPDRITELKGLPFEAYTVAGEVYVGFPSEPIIVVSKSKMQLIKAYEVFRGRSPSLAKTPSSPLTELLPKAGHPFLLAGSVIPGDELFPEDAPPARILQMANSGSLVVGEDDKKTFAQLRLNARTGEAADKLTKIVQGVTAMASLAETNDQQLNEFLRSALVERQDKAVVLRLAYASARIVQMIKGAQDERTASHPTRPPGAPNNGKVLAEWKSDQDIGTDERAPDAPVYRTIENVRLENGTIIMLSARSAERGEQPAAKFGGARFDNIEITPTQGSGSPLHWEAENMKLTRYHIETVKGASGGKLVSLVGSSGSAQFEFPADDGLYTVRVRYVPEPDGKSTFILTAKAPVTEEK